MTHLHVNKLEDYIDYQDDMVNKIHLIETPKSDIKLVALKKHQNLPPHKSEHETMLYVVEGEILFTITKDTEIGNCSDGHCDFEGKKCEYKIKKGEFIRFAGCEEHSIHAEKDTKMLLVCL